MIGEMEKNIGNLSRSNSTDSTGCDCGSQSRSGSAGSLGMPTTPKQEQAQGLQELLELNYPSPVIVVHEDGLPEQYQICIRNTFLEMKDVPTNAGDLPNREVCSCPVSRMVSARSDGASKADAQVPKQQPDQSEDICETSTEVWEHEIHPELESVSQEENNWSVPAKPLKQSRPEAFKQALTLGLVSAAGSSWMFQQTTAPMPVRCPQVGAPTAFSIPRVMSPLVAPPQLQAPMIREVTAPPPPQQAPSFPPSVFSQVPIPPAPQRAPSFPFCREEIGSEKCPSVGSIDHELGTCKPCAFVFKKNGKQGCDSGKDCNFCHLCPPGEKKRRRRGLIEAS
ncbi:unnamed protein product [Durusdinium trenchii]|uniref:C3H1-type domain-containing protein n=1 Tax=Durusdinium trenchii TaxID=1381693 RepID=A0ABP0HVL1_9DINO